MIKAFTTVPRDALSMRHALDPNQLQLDGFDRRTRFLDDDLDTGGTAALAPARKGINALMRSDTHLSSEGQVHGAIGAVNPAADAEVRRRCDALQ